MGPLTESYTKGGTEVALVHGTISSVLSETSRRCGTGVAISCTEENIHLSFMQLQVEVERLAAGFLSMGLKSGDHMMLWGGNHAYLIVAVYACAKAGLVCSCMNPSLTHETAAELLEMGDFRAIVCFPSVKVGLAYRTLCQICPELEKSSKGLLQSKKLPALSHVIMAEDGPHYPCTCLVSNPIAFHLLLRLPYVKKFNIDSLTSVCLVGEHVPPDLIGAMQQNTSIADVTVGLHMTELGCMPVMFPQDGKPEKLLGSQGNCADHYEVKITDFCTASVSATGNVGEVCIKPIGGSEFLGYYKNKQLTESHYSQGWLNTGDVGVMDSDGYINVLGQKQDLICYGSGGKLIYPWVLERRMALHPNVLGVQVVAVTGGLPLKEDKKADSSTICACVVVKEKGVAEIDETHLRENLCQMCREEKLPEPDYIVLLKDFPRTFSKRVQKFKLRELVPDFIGQTTTGK